jgi:two-component system, NtrC family, sensor histidine kinase PilS
MEVTLKTRTSLVADDEIIRRALHYLNGIRLILAPVLLVLSFSPLVESLVPAYKIMLAQASALTYIGAAIVFLVLQLRRSTGPQELASFSLATDLIIVSLILHCFGGVESGLIILLLFTVGISGLLLPLRTALAFASIMTIGLFIDGYLASYTDTGASIMVQAGLYGIAAFVTALGCSLLGRWGREYQLLAERSGVDLASTE